MEKDKKFKFRVGDLVKISKLRRVCEKAYNQGWTEENFTITEQVPCHPPVYKLKDYDGEVLGVVLSTNMNYSE